MWSTFNYFARLLLHVRFCLFLSNYRHYMQTEQANVLVYFNWPNRGVVRDQEVVPNDVNFNLFIYFFYNLN